jgi:hypothetical protein
MEYNTRKRHLNIPEYGRHVQQMVDHAITIEDRDKRNTAAQAIIEVIGNLNPHLRDIPDFKHKLWDHLFIMSDFKLDVDSPYPTPNAEVLFKKPEPMSYPQTPIKYRYYGKTLLQMIKKAVDWEDESQKPELVKALANHMKKSYLNWNRDSVTDDTIQNHLAEISEGKIAFEGDLSQNLPLDQPSNISKRRTKKPIKKNFKRRK